MGRPKGAKNKPKAAITTLEVDKLVAYDIVMPKKRAGGRPGMFNQDLADEICRRLADGQSLRTVCKDDDMPEGRTVWRWLREDEEFSQQYARAKEESADALGENIQEIAEKTLLGHYDPQAARVALDAFKWTASKLKPKKYGDKIDMTTNGKDIPAPIYGGSSVAHND